METAEKMMLVPATRPDASIIKMSELDKAMSQVLKNPTLSSSDKMRLYQQILMRNLEIENKIKNDQITKSDNNIKIDNNKDLIKFDSLPVKKELYDDDWIMSNETLLETIDDDAFNQTFGKTPSKPSFLSTDTIKNKNGNDFSIDNKTPSKPVFLDNLVNNSAFKQVINKNVRDYLVDHKDEFKSVFNHSIDSEQSDVLSRKNSPKLNDLNQNTQKRQYKTSNQEISSGNRGKPTY